MSCYSKHFLYANSTEIDHKWKHELEQVEAWMKEHGIQLFYDASKQMWYDAEGNNGFRLANKGSKAENHKINWRKSGAEGKAWKNQRYWEENLDVESVMLDIKEAGMAIGKTPDGRYYLPFVKAEEERKKKLEEGFIKFCEDSEDFYFSIDTNENLGWDWMGEEEQGEEDEWNNKVSYRFIKRDDELDDLCVEFSLDCMEKKASVKEMVELCESKGIEVYDGRE